MFKTVTALYQTNQVRELDSIAIKHYKISSEELMERAGTAVFAVIKERWPRAKRIVVVCGRGNNAGDGYIVARLAKEAGLLAEVLYLAEPNKLQGEALQAAEKCQAQGVVMKPFGSAELEGEIVVDAVLGSGLSGEVRAEFNQAITAINGCGKPVVAVDIPSGLNADTGNPLGCAVHAEVTITFVGVKQGLYTGAAAEYCGEILFTDLGIPATLYSKIAASAELINLENLSKFLPPRRLTQHKGAFGRVLVLGGDYGMAGAVRMAAEAAARTGAGITMVATRPEHVAAVSGSCPELLCYGISNALELIELLDRATTVVVGPGLGRSQWGEELFAMALKEGKPTVVDADALYHLAKNPLKNSNWILTPHPGEAGGLLKCSTEDVQRDRYAAVRSLQSKYGGVCVLKGAGTLIAAAKHPVAVSPYANPAMASGGMGDVLSGIVAGLLAQGVPLEEAAKYGVMLHANAAELAAQEFGPRGVLATDLIPYLRMLLNEA